MAQAAATRLDDAMIGAGLLAGGANVIMQLAHPAVGYGVYESRVDSGNLFKHPIKRSRTTVTYLAVAALGTDEERKAYRKAVNASHARVRSTPSSPVSYNAFDPKLQLWVAACLYRGFEDVYEAFIGPLTPEQTEEIYRNSARLGTTLQVKEDMWPADRRAFEEYWNEALAEISIDDKVRQHLLDIADLKFLPTFVSRTLGPVNRFVTTGFLPGRFREEMKLDWTPRDQRRFERVLKAVGLGVRLSPKLLREFPFNAYLWDLRRRLRSGRPLV
ncbi:oxygenase MpaB family protein [Amycolatopsis sp. ATCC 39116]|uniref:oxygenase MpaB family protein n=1 Tax=Amycolatopsis sp. (strain ATCC 39116 / 75iv2) TaxID=385957 RepID=UPI00026284AE|nr:oxygenase MpaB family protein [Amycolatopsis sp. ATCC 39116]